jgi:hypothetical protein
MTAYLDFSPTPHKEQTQLAGELPVFANFDYDLCEEDVSCPTAVPRILEFSAAGRRWVNLRNRGGNFHDKSALPNVRGKMRHYKFS